MRTRQWVRPLALILSMLLLLSSVAAARGQEEFERGNKLGGPLGKLVDKAAKQSGVPAEIQVALAYAETRIDAHGGQPSIANGYGVMHLAANPDNHSLEEAATLTKVGADRLKADTAANILGGAAVLASYARAGNGAKLPTGLAGWSTALARYSHFKDDVVARDYDARSTRSSMRASISRSRARTCAWRASRSCRTRAAMLMPAVHPSFRRAMGRRSVPEKDVAWHAGNWSYNTQSIGIEHEGYVSVEVPGATHTDPGPCRDWTHYMSLVNPATWSPVVDNATPGRFRASASWAPSSYSSQRYGADYAYATRWQANANWVGTTSVTRMVHQQVSGGTGSSPATRKSLL